MRRPPMFRQTTADGRAIHAPNKLELTCTSNVSHDIGAPGHVLFVSLTRH
jgi:hypothetical protein